MYKPIYCFFLFLIIFSYSRAEQNKDAGQIFIYASINVDFVLTNLEGKRVGKNPFTNQSFDEIKDATYSTQNGIADAEDPTYEPEGSKYFQYMKAPLGDNYKMEIFSDKGGKYDITVYLHGKSGDILSVKKKEGKLSPKGKDNFNFKHASD